MKASFLRWAAVLLVGMWMLAAAGCTASPAVTQPVDTQPATIPTTEPPPVLPEMTALKALASENPCLEEDVVFALAGDTAVGTVPFLFDEAHLAALRLQVEVSEGDYTFDRGSLNEDGTVDLTGGARLTVTSENGTKSYRVLTRRQAQSIPVVEIWLDTGEDIPQDDQKTYVTGAMTMYGGGYPTLEMTELTLRGRGHSSWLWEKKPYKIKFIEKQSLLGLEAAKDWVLLANYSDRSLIRSYIAHEMPTVLDNLSTRLHQIPVDLFLNGEYKGVYTLGEQLEAKDGRVEIDEDYGRTDTGYLLEVGGSDAEDKKGRDYFHTDILKFVRIKSPDTEKMSSLHFSFINDWCAKADKAVIALDGYEEYIDVDSAIDWFIAHEITYNLDSCFRRSCYFTKRDGGLLEMGPLWDFDLAFGNFSQDRGQYEKFCTLGKDDEDAYIKLTWFNYLFEDPAFTARLRARWDEVKDELLAMCFEKIDAMGALVAPSAAYNFQVWDILGTKAGYSSNEASRCKTYEENLQYLKNFLQRRYNYLDANIPS